MLRLALTRAVEIVGEAATQVSEAGRSEFPGVPWPQIVGMRNRLVHAYYPEKTPGSAGVTVAV